MGADRRRGRLRVPPGPRRDPGPPDGRVGGRAGRRGHAAVHRRARRGLHPAGRDPAGARPLRRPAGPQPTRVGGLRGDPVHGPDRLLHPAQSLLPLLSRGDGVAPRPPQEESLRFRAGRGLGGRPARRRLRRGGRRRPPCGVCVRSKPARARTDPGGRRRARRRAPAVDPVGPVDDATVVLHDGVITAVRPWTPGDGPRLDGLVVPGLVNAHTHLELSHLAGRVVGERPGFLPWLGALGRRAVGRVGRAGVGGGGPARPGRGLRGRRVERGRHRRGPCGRLAARGGAARAARV